MADATFICLESVVFEHGGTLDKFTGDGIMATFGNPTVGGRDAFNALAAARSILASVDAWNVELEHAGKAPIRISVGVHYGDALIGDIGSPRRLEWAVVGDTVNVASRLEHLTRELGCRLVVSDDLVRAVRSQTGNSAETILQGLIATPHHEIRGHAGEFRFWCL